jgi:hypothetical protein
MNNLLSSSASTHQVLVNGLGDVESCSNAAGGVTLLQEVVNQRRSEFNRASALHAGALQNGAAMQSDLRNALNYSLKSDQANLAWARRDVHRGCSGHAAPETANDRKASRYKALFLQIWNPMAPKYGFQTWSGPSL